MLPQMADALGARRYPFAAARVDVALPLVRHDQADGVGARAIQNGEVQLSGGVLYLPEATS